MKSSMLKDVCELLTDGTHYTPPDTGEGVPFLTVKDMTASGLDFQSCSRISDADYATAKAGNSAPFGGDVLFSKDGTVGKVHVVRESIDFAVLSSIAILRPQKAILNSDYLGHVLKSDAVVRQATRNRTGTALRRIILKDLARLTIPLPPLAEQKRIAAILDQADALRDKRRQAIAKLDELLQSVFLDMFGDPVTNPKGWEVVCLSEHFARDREGTKCGPFGSALKKHEYTDDGIPVWLMDNIRESRFEPAGCLHITEGKYAELQSYAVLDGDIIISRAGTVGKMCVVETDTAKSIISTNLIRLSLNRDSLDPWFFVCLMTYCKGRIGRLKTGDDGTYTFMNAGILKQLRIPLPAIAIQRRFLRVLRHVESQKTQLERHSDRLDTLFASLQQRAFKGDL